jgi:hypothetical protein
MRMPTTNSAVIDRTLHRKRGNQVPLCGGARASVRRPSCRGLPLSFLALSLLVAHLQTGSEILEGLASKSIHDEQISHPGRRQGGVSLSIAQLAKVLPCS